MKTFGINNVKEFLRTHLTYWERIDVPDDDVCDYFEISDIPVKLKQRFYSIYRTGLNLLLDELEAMPVFDYKIALYNIKKMGFCIPIRQKNWGWQEPMTIDELEDYLKKLYDRWHLISDNALERINHIKKTKQTKLHQYKNNENNND